MLARLGRYALGIFLLLFTVLSGLIGLLVPPVPDNFIAAFPHVIQVLWSAGLTAGGLIALAGIAMGGVHGAYVERAGLWWLTGLSACIGIVALGHWHSVLGWVSVGIVLLYGLCCLARAVSIKDEAKERALLKQWGARS